MLLGEGSSDNNKYKHLHTTTAAEPKQSTDHIGFIDRRLLDEIEGIPSKFNSIKFN